MNVVISSSRGEGLEEFLPANTTVDFTKGGKLEDLTKTAKKHVPPPYGLSKKRTHLYFVCGIPDISTLAKDKITRYRECIYPDDPNETADNFLNKLNESSKTTLRCGALPIFANIPQFDLSTYNSHQRTSHRKFTQNYHEMQTNLEQAIDKCNDH